MIKTLFRFAKPVFYNLSAVVHAHGWKNLAPFDWQQEQGLFFALQTRRQAVDLQVTETNSYLGVRVRSYEALTTGERQDVRAAVSRALSLNEDVAELHALASKLNKPYARLIEIGAGRMLRAPSLWEDIAKTLFTTNCSWRLTCIMAKAACDKAYSQATPMGRYPFVLPSSLAKMSTDKIQKKLRVGYRAPYLRAIAKRFIDAGSEQSLLNDIGEQEAAQQFFSELPGFGPYATHHMLLLCGFYDHIPVDSVVRGYIKKMHGQEDVNKCIASKYKKWGKFMWWGMQLEKIYRKQTAW